MLKADLHLHCKGDPLDDRAIKYNARELIDKMASLKYDVIALTPHLYNDYDKNLIKYAKKKKIILLWGAELRLEGKHILVYNIDMKKLEKIKRINDLGKLRRKDNLIIAPHPYFIFGSLGKKLDKNIGLFDGIEISWFYTKILNRNKKAIKLAREYNKPLIGTSDCHNLEQIGFTYSFIDSKKNVSAIIKAIKSGKVQVITEPLKIRKMIKLFIVNSFSVLKTMGHRKIIKRK